MSKRKLLRSSDDYIVAGVCGGLAEYFQIDSSLVRIIFILLILGCGSGFFVYIILWLIVPKSEGKEPDRKEKIKEFAGDVEKTAKSMAKEINLNTKIKKAKRINILGVILILVGIIALWDQLFPWFINWDLVWPGVLILLGVLLIFRD
jgi:phage shock protein PspC (stress-responsive transcriptional regulator)